MAAHMIAKGGSRGQALPEYVVGTMLVWLALFAPINEAPFNGNSAIGALVAAFQRNYASYEFAVSQPTLN